MHHKLIGSTSEMEQPDMYKRRFDVALASDLCVDLVMHGNVRPEFNQKEQIVGSYALELGGSANIFACQLAKLSVSVGVIGHVGRDLFGDFVLAELRGAGVDTTLIQRSADILTGLGVALVEPEDRAILTVLGGIEAALTEDLPQKPALFCRHWHLASPFLLRGLRPVWHEFLSKAKLAGVSISLDPNWDPDNRWEGIVDLLPLIDVFLPNEAEAIALTQESDAKGAARKLAVHGCLVVIKCGSSGVIAADAQQEWALSPADMQHKPNSIVDTVGAGDNFDAGFIYEWLKGSDVNYCLHFGHRCAVASLSSAGGIKGQLIDF